MCRRVSIARLMLSLFCASSIAAATPARHFPVGTQEVNITSQSGIRPDLLPNIAALVEKSIADGNYPGAVILASHHGHIFYRGVFGNRRIMPDVAPMRFDTIFDLASLTKVVATTPAIMQLVESGKINLDAPVAFYWPAFGNKGKGRITVRELLTHTSGLSPDLPDTNGEIIGAAETLQQIEDLKPQAVPGTVFVYSDINFIVLGHLIEKITRENLAHYTQEHIFKMLGMKDTAYLPQASLRDRIAPSEIIHNKLRWGEVNDPGTYAMNGISGAAGVFSDAGDLGLYLQCLLDNGRITHATGKDGKKSSRYLLGPLSILKMTTPQTAPDMTDLRGLGWDLDSRFVNRGILFPVSSYGHTGWTGTAVWVDPITQTWIVILTSRTHPTPLANNKIIQDRRAIADIIAGSITDVSIANLHNTGVGELNRAYKLQEQVPNPP
jgi:CubicO group peptidase (beta-lactamase class C family)